MEDHRFDTLVRALQPTNRRSLLGGAIGGVLGLTALALGQDESSAAKKHKKNKNNNTNQRKRKRRTRKRVWNLLASPLTYHNETPSSGGDKFATSACQAQIKIVKRRKRFQICGNFTYGTTAVANHNINVKDVIIQPGNTGHSTPAVVTFSGWSGVTTYNAGCQGIDGDLARDILNDPTTYYVNVRTTTPSHPHGAVAASLVK